MEADLSGLKVRCRDLKKVCTLARSPLGIYSSSSKVPTWTTEDWSTEPTSSAYTVHTFPWCLLYQPCRLYRYIEWIRNWMSVVGFFLPWNMYFTNFCSYFHRYHSYLFVSSLHYIVTKKKKKKSESSKLLFSIITSACMYQCISIINLLFVLINFTISVSHYLTIIIMYIFMHILQIFQLSTHCCSTPIINQKLMTFMIFL